MATQDITIWNEGQTKAASVDDREGTLVGLNTITGEKSHGTYYPQQREENLAYGDVYPQLSNADGIQEVRASVLTDEFSDYQPFGGNALPDGWTSVIGAGGSISVANSILTLNSGTTSGSQTYVYNEYDYLPIEMMWVMKMSNRRANQQIYFGMTDTSDPATDTMFARFRFDGTDASKVYCETMSTTDTGGVEGDSTLRTLPSSITSANYALYAILITHNRIAFLAGNDLNNLTEIATNHVQLINPYTPLYARIRIQNTGAVAGNTIVSVDSITINNVNKVDIANTFSSEPLSSQIIGYDGTILRPVAVDTAGNLKVATVPSPTSIGNSIAKFASLAIAGTFPTTVLSYTVTAGKTLYIYNYHLQATGNGTAEATIQVGGVTKMQYEVPGTAGLQQFGFGISSPLIATSGQTVTIVADTGSSSNKTYKASFNGVEI